MTLSKREKRFSNKKKTLLSSESVKKIKSMVNFCYNCNRCVNVCPLSQLGIFSPRDLIYDLNFLTIDETLENNNIWMCLTCGQCTAYCPMSSDSQGIKIPELILELRKEFNDYSLEAEKIMQCETHNDIFNFIPKLMAENPNPPNKLSFINENNLKTKDSGEIAYFIGCLPLMEDIIYNFKVDYISTAKTIIHILNEVNIVPVVLNEKCCGHDLLWSKGDYESFKKLAEYNVKIYRDAGVKTIIFSCAEGYRTWKIDYPKIIKDFDFEILHFSEFFLKNDIIEKINFPTTKSIKVTYHDACRIGRFGPKLYDAPRNILKKLPDVQLIEMKNIKEDAICCGVSGFVHCNEYSHTLRENRINEAVNTGADYLIVPCPKCLTHYTCYLNEPNIDRRQKYIKNKIKVIDLASFIGQIINYT